MSRREVRKPEWIHVYFVSQRYLGTRGLNPALDLMALSARRWDILTDAHSKPDLLLGSHLPCTAQVLGVPLQRKLPQNTGPVLPGSMKSLGKACGGMQIAFWDQCKKRKSACGIWPISVAFKVENLFSPKWRKHREHKDILCSGTENFPDKQV